MGDFLIFAQDCPLWVGHPVGFGCRIDTRPGGEASGFLTLEEPPGGSDANVGDGGRPGATTKPGQVLTIG